MSRSGESINSRGYGFSKKNETNSSIPNNEHNSFVHCSQNDQSTYSHSSTPKQDQNALPLQIEQVNNFQQSLDAAERDSVPNHQASPVAPPMNPYMPLFFPFPTYGSPNMQTPFPFVFQMPQMTPNANAALSAATSMAFQHNGLHVDMQKSQEVMQQFAMGFAMAAMMTQESNASKAQPTHHQGSAQHQNNSQFQHVAGPVPPLPFLPSGSSTESQAETPNQQHLHNM